MVSRTPHSDIHTSELYFVHKRKTPKCRRADPDPRSRKTRQLRASAARGLRGGLALSFFHTFSLSPAASGITFMIMAKPVDTLAYYDVRRKSP
jgi:hypothetical protein